MLGLGKSLSPETKFNPTAQLARQRCRIPATVLAQRVRSVYCRFAQNLSNIFEMSVTRKCELTVIQKHVFESTDGGCSNIWQVYFH